MRPTRKVNELSENYKTFSVQPVHLVIPFEDGGGQRLSNDGILPLGVICPGEERVAPSHKDCSHQVKEHPMAIAASRMPDGGRGGTNEGQAATHVNNIASCYNSLLNTGGGDAQHEF